jgi:hypothetical protein
LDESDEPRNAGSLI